VSGDLGRGEGIDAAVAVVDVIVHCASGLRGDVEAARHLLEAARRAGSPQLVYISIVGVDRTPLGYYRAKLAVERLVENSGLPWTILRATQFHDLLMRMFAAQRWLPVLLVPARTSFQPIDAGEVAARLAELATAAPAGRVADLGGPEIRTATGLAHYYLHAYSRHRPVLPVLIPARSVAATALAPTSRLSMPTATSASSSSSPPRHLGRRVLLESDVAVGPVEDLPPGRAPLRDRDADMRSTVTRRRCRRLGSVVPGRPVRLTG
jgi:uncharacterized protein YbjT (DUF2867 family)